MNKITNNLIDVGKIKVLCKVSNALCSNQERGTAALGSKVALLSTLILNPLFVEDILSRPV